MDMLCNFVKDERKLSEFTLWYCNKQQALHWNGGYKSLMKRRHIINLTSEQFNHCVCYKLYTSYLCLHEMKSTFQVSGVLGHMWKKFGKIMKRSWWRQGISSKITQKNFLKPKLMSWKEHQTVISGAEWSCWQSTVPGVWLLGCLFRQQDNRIHQQTYVNFPTQSLKHCTIFCYVSLRMSELYFTKQYYGVWWWRRS